MLYNSHNLTSVVCTFNLFYLTHRYDAIRCAITSSQREWSWEQWQWRCTPQSPNLQVWSFAIRWFNVISRTLVGVGSYLSAETQSVYSTAPTDLTEKKRIKWNKMIKIISGLGSCSPFVWFSALSFYCQLHLNDIFLSCSKNPKILK